MLTSPRPSRVVLTTLVLLLTGSVAFAEDGEPQDSAAITPMALLPFQERGHEAQQLGPQVTDLLFAELVTNPNLFLVEREDIDKLFEENTLGLSGLVDPNRATQVGHLTGAKVIVTGSVIVSGENIYLVAKVMGTETSRVLGASAKDALDADLHGLVSELAEAVATTVSERSKELIAEPLDRTDMIAALAKRMPKGKRPAVWIEIAEQHVGRPVIDPAAETELALICRELGFTVIDRTEGKKSAADVLLVGEGISQFAVRHSDLTSVKARVELKALDRRTGEVLAIDRQVSIRVDLAEQLAAKSALQDAAMSLAERMLPALVGKRERQK
jgi:TolB-like protein